MLIDSAKKKVLQTTLQVASQLAPTIAAKITWRLFCTPQVASRPTPSQALALDRARETRVPFGQRELRMYTWGESGPNILAVHGWGGRAHVFGDLVQPLVDAGFRVTSFDAPGHRRLGQRTNMMEYSSAIRAVARQVGTIEGIVGHSFGAFTSAYTAKLLPELKAICLIGAPDGLNFMLDYAQKEMAAPPKIMGRLERRIEKLSGEPVRSHSTVQYLERIAVPKLFIHDHDDRDIPVEKAVTMADELKAEIFLTKGYGHHRVLTAASVSDRLVSFLSDMKKEPGF